MLLGKQGTVMLKGSFSSPLPWALRADTVNSFSSKPKRHQDSEQSVTA